MESRVVVSSTTTGWKRDGNGGALRRDGSFFGSGSGVSSHVLVPGPRFTSRRCHFNGWLHHEVPLSMTEHPRKYDIALPGRDNASEERGMELSHHHHHHTIFKFVKMQPYVCPKAGPILQDRKTAYRLSLKSTKPNSQPPAPFPLFLGQHPNRLMDCFHQSAKSQPATDTRQTTAIQCQLPIE